jgi:hypothetical protein
MMSVMAQLSPQPHQEIRQITNRWSAASRISGRRASLGIGSSGSSFMTSPGSRIAHFLNDCTHSLAVGNILADRAVRSSALMMELLHRYSGFKRMIDERFGGLEEGLVNRSRRAIRERMETEPRVQKNGFGISRS